MAERIITSSMLRMNPDCIFVFGDNLLRVGCGGAAALRDEPNTYGFITKINPDHLDSSYYRPAEYIPVYASEIAQLAERIRNNPGYTFWISRLGAGLANKYHIFEQVIEPTIKHLLGKYPNVEFLWD